MVPVLSICSGSEVKQWIIQTLVPHLHQNPSLGLVGLPRLQYTQTHSPLESIFQGDTVVTRELTLTEMSMSDWSMKMYVNDLASSLSLVTVKEENYCY